jgi:hypothetical protein
LARRVNNQKLLEAQCEPCVVAEAEEEGETK